MVMTHSIPRKGPNILALLLLLPMQAIMMVFCNGYEVFTLFVWVGMTHSEQSQQETRCSRWQYSLFDQTAIFGSLKGQSCLNLRGLRPKITDF